MWAGEQGKAKARAEVGDRLPEFREQLLNTKGEERLAVLKTIQRNGVEVIMDDSFLDAMEVCADDSNVDVRRMVAQIAGKKWVADAEEQLPRAVELMLRLSYDVDNGTQNIALYLGLIPVKNKQEAVIRRLVEAALVMHMPDHYDRIIKNIVTL